MVKQCNKDQNNISNFDGSGSILCEPAFTTCDVSRVTSDFQIIKIADCRSLARAYQAYSPDVICSPAAGENLRCICIARKTIQAFIKLK